MQNIKLIKGLSISSTVIMGIISVLCVAGVILLLSLFGPTGDMAGKSLDYATGIDGNDPGAGYMLIGSLALSAWFGLGAILLIVVAIFLGIIAVAYLIPSIVGIILPIATRKSESANGYLVDGVVKLIFNTFPFLLVIYGMIDEQNYEWVMLIILLILFIIEGLATGELILSIVYNSKRKNAV